MRTSPVIILSLFLAATPFTAHAGNTGALFGTYTCPQALPCDGYALSSNQWAAIGAICAKKAFGYGMPNLFDEAAGLDDDNCLTAIPESIPKENLTRLIPRCCSVQKQDGNCYMYCELRQE